MISDQVIQPVQFVADGPLRSVSVAGTFNSWNKDATPMVLGADGRTWSTKLKLPFGKLRYKFVLDGERWIVDPKNRVREDDGNGNVNSVLMIWPEGYEQPASPNDGRTAVSALRHESGIKWLNYDQGKLNFSLRARPSDLASVSLVVNGKAVPMRPKGEDEIFTTYSAAIPWNRKQDLSYWFEYRDGDRKGKFAPAGSGKAFRLVANDFRPFTVPNWVERGVIYQIFPDRFANGSPANDAPKTEAWDAKPTWYNTFGGDVEGVASRVDYIKRLGVKAVYFTPVFRSPSVHRYDATDFKQVDPKFGTNEQFYNLTKTFRRNGIRTIMDFAFNHTAVDFPPFLDVRQKGAESAYKDWYWIKSYPVEVRDNPPYAAFYGFPSMPKLNVMNPAAHAYVLSVIDFWRTNAALDGLRLDVANEVDPQMWRDLRATLKPKSPNTWILGEEWGDASAWLGGDQWDASMNYPFRGACVDFFARGTGDGQTFLNRMLANYAMYPPQVSRNQFNLLCSHDTERFLTDCQGDARKANLARVFQMTWVGTPSVYYGEEVGMEGGRDPDNRRGMRWDLATDANPTLRLFRSLIAIRNGSRELQSGEPVALASSGGALAFARVLDGRCAVVGINRADAPVTLSVTLPEGVVGRRYRDAQTGQSITAQNQTISLLLPAYGSAILLPSAGSPSSRTFAQLSARRSQ